MMKNRFMKKVLAVLLTLALASCVIACRYEAPKSPIRTMMEHMQGDWHGLAVFEECEGKYEHLNGSNADAIVRLYFDQRGNCSPFIALYMPNDMENNFTDVAAKQRKDWLGEWEMGLKGKFAQTDLDPDESRIVWKDNNSLYVYANFEGEEDSVHMRICLRRLGEAGDPDNDDPYFNGKLAWADGMDFKQIVEVYGINYETLPPEATFVPTGDDSKPEGGEESTGGASWSGATGTVDFYNDGRIKISYPSDNWSWNNDYGKLKSNKGQGILIDPLLGKSNYQEWKTTFTGDKYTGQDGYKFEETTLMGYPALICDTEDWLGASRQVVIDTGDKLAGDGIFGVRFSISADAAKDCWTDEIIAILNTLQLTPKK